MRNVGDNARVLDAVDLLEHREEEVPEHGALKGLVDAATRALLRHRAIAQPADKVGALHLLEARLFMHDAQSSSLVTLHGIEYRQNRVLLHPSVARAPRFHRKRR